MSPSALEAAMAHLSDRLVSANKLIIAAAALYAGAVSLAHADPVTVKGDAYDYCIASKNCSTDFLAAALRARHAQQAAETAQATRDALDKLNGTEFQCPVGKYALDNARLDAMDAARAQLSADNANWSRLLIRLGSNEAVRAILAADMEAINKADYHFTHDLGRCNYASGNPAAQQAAVSAAARQRAENAAYEADAMKRAEGMKGIFGAPVVHCMTDADKLCAYPH
jgi:hypothetical protein